MTSFVYGYYCTLYPVCRSQQIPRTLISVQRDFSFSFIYHAMSFNRDPGQISSVHMGNFSPAIEVKKARFFALVFFPLKTSCNHITFCHLHSRLIKGLNYRPFLIGPGNHDVELKFIREDFHPGYLDCSVAKTEISVTGLVRLLI